eukprot:NODE_29_length_37665_cov_1.081563.p9 type:complete len:389 gc:universal NODE_29_length_37665_cov_1.081563:18049-16883(-)
MHSFIISGKRTPIGSFQGQLSSLSAIDLAVEVAQIVPVKNDIEEVFFGHVLSANQGQNPARQVCVHSGLEKAIGTQINKVCASGMKAISIANLSILCGADAVLAVGSESMSNAPYYVNRGLKYGSTDLRDGLQYDGLLDPFQKKLMGECADGTAEKYSISREQQDNYAIESFRRAVEATDSGCFKNEILPIEIRGRQKTVVKEDENIRKLKVEKVKELKPVFTKDGTVTAANASPLSDGASAVVIVSEKQMSNYLKDGHIKKGDAVFKILACADSEQDSVDFVTTPHLAIPKALKKADITLDQVDYYEINEAFAVAGLVNAQLLNIPLSKVNIRGGAVALGHPLGCSGIRVVVTLMNILNDKKAKYGCAGICNGGGGASAIVIERIIL